MKMKYIILGIVVIVFVCFLCFRKNEAKNGKIEGIKRLNFVYSTGNYADGSIHYELLCDGDCKLYYKGDAIPEEDRKEYTFDKKKIAEIEKKLQEYGVEQWDGFRGGNDQVLDGRDFSFYLVYGDGEKVDALGYENWPKNYSEVKKYLTDVFSSYVSDEDNHS